MPAPSVRGSIFRTAVADVARLVDAGRLSEDVLGAHLEDQDLPYLKAELLDSTWYPLATYVRLLDLLGDVEGNGDDQYFVERGRENARRLMRAGFYRQLDFLGRWRESMSVDVDDESAVISRYASSLKLVVSMSATIYNVGKWVVERDPDSPGRVRIAVRGASAYDEPLRLSAEGFLNECGSRHTSTDRLYTSVRLSPDLLLFRMNHDIMDLLGGSVH